jgi:hypothetical protein
MVRRARQLYTENKYFYDSSYLKCSRLVNHKKLDKYVQFLNGRVLGCLVPAKRDHLGADKVRFLDDCCIDASKVLFRFSVLQNGFIGD